MAWGWLCALWGWASPSGPACKGRNWGSSMTQKSEPELVTSSPYRLVRHPIYSAAYPLYKRSTKMLVPFVC